MTGQLMRGQKVGRVLARTKYENFAGVSARDDKVYVARALNYSVEKKD
jgi:hypothetical protein